MVSTTPQNATPGRHLPQAALPQPAGFFSRSEAFVIDLIILTVIQVLGSAFLQILVSFFKLVDIVEVVVTTLENSTFRLVAGSIVTSLLVIGYFAFFWSLFGFTPGKAILGLRVVKRNGEKVSFFRALLRFLGYWISAIPLFLGYFWVLWDPKRQAWHDKLAGTQVLYIPKKPHK